MVTVQISMYKICLVPPTYVLNIHIHVGYRCCSTYVPSCVLSVSFEISNATSLNLWGNLGLNRNLVGYPCYHGISPVVVPISTLW